MLDFPIIRQSTTYTCNCACLQACLCYYGIDKREGELAKLMNVTAENSNEVHPKKIIKTAQKFGLKAEYLKLTKEDIIDYINDDIPVIVNFQAWSEDKDPDYSYGKDSEGHYAIIIGYDGKNFIFSDPCSFYKTSLSYKEFEERWHDGYPEDEDYDHMGIILYGKKPVFDSKLIKKVI
jgi:ABC-type bacteriocin/lantibiotic exporter with double-glycine peptidase domain